MAITANETNPDKFQRYRENQKRRGMKMLRVWVPDPHAPGFAAEAERQAVLLKGAPEELEALAFIAAANAAEDEEAK
jgi:hypothetical protein